MPLVIKSTAFTPKGAMSIKYTCEGDDVSPPLVWSGAPEPEHSDDSALPAVILVGGLTVLGLGLVVLWAHL